jgi:hypothetical protein
MSYPWSEPLRADCTATMLATAVDSPAIGSGRSALPQAEMRKAEASKTANHCHLNFFDFINLLLLSLRTEGPDDRFHAVWIWFVYLY